MSYPILYFGVELEFNIAYTQPGDISETPMDSRASQFEPTEETFETVRSYFPEYTKSSSMSELFRLPTSKKEDFARDTVMRHTIDNSIRERLMQAGVPVLLPDFSYADTRVVPLDLNSWIIAADSTIEPPKNARNFRWLDLELVSPAYQFNPENVEAVEKVCNLLTAKYLTNTNRSTGLHIHISFGIGKKWKLSSLKNLLMFFWTFQYQFDTLHPQHRQNTEVARTMRRDSQMAHKHWDKYFTHISSKQGLAQLDDIFDIQELVRATMGTYNLGRSIDRYMAYNTKPIWDSMQPRVSSSDSNKTTLEFRQHEGTLDGERVTQWIKLLCRVIEFVENVQPRSFVNLLSVVSEKEEWSKIGDPVSDISNERKYGPILAVGAWMITDLLEHMGLQEAADFYRDRLHPVSDRTGNPDDW